MKNIFKKAVVAAGLIALPLSGMAQGRGVPAENALSAIRTSSSSTPQRAEEFRENAKATGINETENVKTAKGYNLRGQGYNAAIDFILDSTATHPVMINLSGSKLGEAFTITKKAVSNMDNVGVENIVLVLSDPIEDVKTSITDDIGIFVNGNLLGSLTLSLDGEWWYTEGVRNAVPKPIPENDNVQSFLQEKIAEASEKVTGIKPSVSYTQPNNQ